MDGWMSKLVEWRSLHYFPSVCLLTHGRMINYIHATRGSSFFLGKVTALAVLCCFVLLFV